MALDHMTALHMQLLPILNIKGGGGKGGEMAATGGGGVELGDGR